MNIITSSEMYAPRPEVTANPQQPKQIEQTNSFQTVMDVEVFAPGDNRGCNGTSNVLDMEAFFAAWGSSDSTYDVDGNGIVDGGDLTILLANQMEDPLPGSVDDVLQQWGVEGESTADLNGDALVDGADLMLALGGAGAAAASEEIEIENMTKLETLLADWGTDNIRSDFTGDGIVDGADLSYLLGGGMSSESTQTSGVARELPTLNPHTPKLIHDAVETFNQASAREGTKEVGVRIVDHLKKMGFESEPPSNLMELIHAFKLNPTSSRALLSNIVDLFGGRDGSTLAHA